MEGWSGDGSIKGGYYDGWKKNLGVHDWGD